MHLPFQRAFESCTELIQRVGEGNAYLVWVIGLYLGQNDFLALASDALTDNSNEKI